MGAYLVCVGCNGRVRLKGRTAAGVVRRERRRITHSEDGFGIQVRFDIFAVGILCRVVRCLLVIPSSDDFDVEALSCGYGIWTVRL